MPHPCAGGQSDAGGVVWLCVSLVAAGRCAPGMCSTARALWRHCSIRWGCGCPCHATPLPLSHCPAAALAASCCGCYACSGSGSADLPPSFLCRLGPAAPCRTPFTPCLPCPLPSRCCSMTCWRWRGAPTASSWPPPPWTDRSTSGTHMRRYCRYQGGTRVGRKAQQAPPRSPAPCLVQLCAAMLTVHNTLPVCREPSRGGATSRAAACAPTAAPPTTPAAAAASPPSPSPQTAPSCWQAAAASERGSGSAPPPAAASATALSHPAPQPPVKPRPPVATHPCRYVCLYDVAERVMLRRFQISHNKSLDGVLDQLNSR